MAMFLLTAAAVAQVGSRGVLAGAPAAILVDGGVVPGADAETRVHRNGFSLLPTVPLPNLIQAANLHEIFTMQNAPAGIDVDDISTGRDDVLIDANGWLAVPPSSWGVLSFSLKSGAIGVPASGTQPASRIAQQAAEGDVGATLFSWILPGSAVPATLVGTGRVERSHSRSELGLSAGTIEVDGLDVPLVLGLDQIGLAQLEPGFAALVGNPQSIYFTVSHATRGVVPASWWFWNGVPTLSSGATILRTRKFGATWTTPSVFQPYTVLGLGRDEDIDGLAYDGFRDKLLFSTVGTTRDQFLFVDMVFDGPIVPVEVKQADGVTKVSNSIGKGQNDDVDALCTLDPRIGSIGTPPPPPNTDDFGSSCGTPVQALLGTPVIHASAFRRRSGATTFYDTWMMGWPPSTGQGPGFAAMFLTFGASIDLNLFSPVFLRDPSNPVVGDPQHFALVVPAAVALQNFDVTARWIAADAALTEIAEAWPVRLFL